MSGRGPLLALLAISLGPGGLLAQQPTPAPPQPDAATTIEAVPLLPFRADFPFASQRDGARFYLQAANAAFNLKKDIDAAVRLLVQSAAIDPSYKEAIFNLAILTLARGQEDDAQRFLNDVAADKESPLAKLAEKELERATAVGALEKTEEGKRQRQYDIALVAAIQEVNSAPLQKTIDTFTRLTRQEAGRWEAHSLLAATLLRNGHFVDAVPYLRSAAAAAQGDIRTKLTAAAAETETEVAFGLAQGEAQSAWTAVDYPRAAKQYAKAWETRPHRSDQGILAVTASLMADDIPGAVTVLRNLKANGQPEDAARAAAMLKKLAPVDEEAARAADAPTGGKTIPAPPPIESLLPNPVTPAMLVATQPPAKLIEDKGEVAPIEAFFEDPLVREKANLDAAASAAVPYPGLAGQRPFAELSELRTPAIAERVEMAADLSKGTASPGEITVNTTPAGANILVDAETIPACQTPCWIRLTRGPHTLRLTLHGYEEMPVELTIAPKDSSRQEFALRPRRAIVTVASTTAGLPIFVNGVAINLNTPSRLSLLPGTYSFGVQAGGQLVERQLMLREDKPLLLQFKR